MKGKKLIVFLCFVIMVMLCVSCKHNVDDVGGIEGKWYCSNGGLRRYLEFYSDGTGKAYASSPDNHSSFRWTTSGNKMTFSEGITGVVEFSVSATTLTLKDERETLTYTRQ